MPSDTFKIGDVVDVRNYGRAQVIETVVTDASSRFYGRIRVKYQSDGKTYYTRPENLRKTVQVKQRVLLCHSTTHYRTCAASVVNWNDAVLEVGCHEGECTWLLSRRCHYIVGIDKSHTTVEAARRRYPGLSFHAVDGFDVPALKALGPPDGSGFSVVLVDIGGIASLTSVAALVGLYYKEFPYTTKIVVKSVFLKRMVEDSLPYNTERNNPWAMLGAGSREADSNGGSGERAGPSDSALKQNGEPDAEGPAGNDVGHSAAERDDYREVEAEAASCSDRPLQEYTSSGVCLRPTSDKHGAGGKAGDDERPFTGQQACSHREKEGGPKTATGLQDATGAFNRLEP